MIEIDIVVNVIEPEEEEGKKRRRKRKEERKENPMTIHRSKGSTLCLTKRYNVHESIVSANNITNPDAIMPGQQLVIPKCKILFQIPQLQDFFLKKWGY